MNIYKFCLMTEGLDESLYDDSDLTDNDRIFDKSTEMAELIRETCGIETTRDFGLYAPALVPVMFTLKSDLSQNAVLALFDRILPAYLPGLKYFLVQSEEDLKRLYEINNRPKEKPNLKVVESGKAS